jgi:hypothetical protein
MCLGVVRQRFIDLVKRSEDFLLLENSPTFYLFTKSPNPCPITSKHTNRTSSFNPPFKIAPKHHRQSEPNASEEKRRLIFLNSLIDL